MTAILQFNFSLTEPRGQSVRPSLRRPAHKLFMGSIPCLLLISLFIRNCLLDISLCQGLSRTVFANLCMCLTSREKMLPAKLVVAASFLITAFDAIAAAPHIRERHIIRVPLKFKIIHHHKIQKIPIIIRKHVHYYKEEQPIIEHANSNHIFRDDSDDRFGDHFHLHQEHQGFLDSGISHDHHSDHVTQEDDYDDEEQSQEDEYENDEYE